MYYSSGWWKELKERKQAKIIYYMLGNKISLFYSLQRCFGGQHGIERRPIWMLCCCWCWRPPRHRRPSTTSPFCCLNNLKIKSHRLAINTSCNQVWWRWWWGGEGGGEGASRWQPDPYSASTMQQQQQQYQQHLLIIIIWNSSNFIFQLTAAAAAAVNHMYNFNIIINFLV